MARKLRGFERVLDAPALFAVAYGEIASSLYIALGIVAGAALGLTPLVLLVDGRGVRPRLALLRRGHDRAARDRRSGDVRAPRVQRPRRLRHGLGALPRLPHRHGALGALRARTTSPARSAQPSLREAPWDAVVGCAPDRRDRRRAARRGGRDCTSARSPSRSSTCSCRAMLVLLGLALLLSPDDARRRPRLRERPGLERPRVRAAARDARVHRARDGREPRRGGDRARAARCRGRSSPRSGSSSS